jgi:hypothetical protein
VGALAAVLVATAAAGSFMPWHKGHTQKPGLASESKTTPTPAPAPATTIRATPQSVAPATDTRAPTAKCTRVISPPGSIASAEAAAHPGDVLCLRGGVYKQLVDLTQSGTPKAALTVMSVPGERAIIDGTGLHVKDALLVLNASYVILRDLTVQNSANFGLTNYGHHDTIHGSLIQKTRRSGIVTTGSGGGENDYNWYDHNEITQTVLANTNDAVGATGWDSAIDNVDGTGASGNNLYTDNIVHDNWGEGQAPADHDTLRANTYFDNWSAEVYLDGAQYVTVEKNLMYTTYRQRPALTRRLGTGIGFADASPARSSWNVVRNNIIENLGTGMNFRNSGAAGTGMQHDQIDNNTIVNTWNCGICFDAGAHTATLIRDNLVVPRSGTVTAGTSASGITATANLFTTRGAVNDPHLVGEGTFSFNPDGYRLTSKSTAAVDRGVPSSATDDYDATRRPQGAGYDIGVFELH